MEKVSHIAQSSFTEQLKLRKAQRESRRVENCTSFPIADLYTLGHKSLSAALAFMEQEMLDNAESGCLTYSISYHVRFPCRSSCFGGEILDFPYWPNSEAWYALTANIRYKLAKRLIANLVTAFKENHPDISIDCTNSIIAVTW